MTDMVVERTGYDIGAALKRAKARPEYDQETILIEVARRISDAMDEQHVSRADLARKLGVSPAYITKVLRGTENFSLQTLARIAFALGRKWDFLLVNPNADPAAYSHAEEDRRVHSARVAEGAARPAYGARTRQPVPSPTRPIRREPRSRRKASKKKSRYALKQRNNTGSNDTKGVRKRSPLFIQSL